MSGWAQGSQLDTQSFAHHFFHRDADDLVVTSLRDAAVGAKTATSQSQLAAASEQLANAMTIVGLDRWARFVAHAVEQVRDSTTIAAVAKSLQPIPAAYAASGKPGSGSVGGGTRLVQSNEPPVEPDTLPLGESESLPSPRVKMPSSPLAPLEPDTPEGESGSRPNVLRLPVPAAPEEAPAVKQAAPPAKAPNTNPVPAVEAKGGRSVPKARVTRNGRIHILDGDGRGGGHRAGAGKPNKSEFPASWSDDKIIAEIESVANDPASKRSPPDKRGKVEIEESRDGVDIVVVLSKDQRTIISAYPTNLPINPPRGK